jgi:AcrR family transcriptional regulator
MKGYFGSMPGKRSPRKRARPRAYHHGDLKAALVQAAVEILQKEGLEGLTLRAVARRAGVSPAAPYRHFADRRALVAALAERGFNRLEQAMLSAMQSGEGRAGLKQVAFAYIRFALDNPTEYRVMFGPEVANSDDLPALRTAARSSLGFVAHGIAALQQGGLVGEGDPNLIAVATWATLHGLAILTLDGQTTGLAPNVDALVEEATRIMMFGMAGRAK